MAGKSCSDRCGECCEKWIYPRKYHNDPLRYIRELESQMSDNQKGVRLVPHPNYKSYLSCAYLKKKPDGTTSCGIYEKRPSYCKKFYCT